MRMAKFLIWTATLLGFIIPAWAVPTGCTGWDSSGNGKLKGTYYMRQVVWQVGDQSGDLGDAVSVYGTVTFDGNGNYVFAGALVEAATLTLTPINSLAGTYVVSASGYTCMDSLLNNVLLSTGETIFGLVSNSIFIGSSTENFSGAHVNDMAIAAPLASPIPTAASLSGSYTFVDFDSPVVGQSGGVVEVRDSLFTFTADGKGTLTGTTAGTGYIGATGTTRQNLSNVKFVFSSGAGNLMFPSSSSPTALIQGNHYIYLSPDGNFFFGGSPTGWDMIVGIRNSPGTPANFAGLYYQAGMDINLANLSTAGTAGVDSYYGSFKALGTSVAQPNIIGHERLNTTTAPISFDFTYIDGYTFNSDGSSDDGNTSQHYVYGLNGAVRIGIGNSPSLGINVALAAPTFASQPGVFLDPTTIVNAASNAPATAQIVAGELITMSGTNLAPSFLVSTNGFQFTLNGVQVLINGTPCPIYSVFPNQVTVLVPYEVTPGVATVQVINGTAQSNIATMFVGTTQPGVFTFNTAGIEYGRAVRVSDSTLISPSNQAKANDVLNVFVTGLGGVTPAISDGTVSPANDVAANTIGAFIGGATATVSFAGLEPGSVGVYMVTLTVPTGLTPGDNILEITGPDGDTYEARISIGSGTASAVSADLSRTDTLVRPHNLTGPNRQKDRILPATINAPTPMSSAHKTSNQ